MVEGGSHVDAVPGHAGDGHAGLCGHEVEIPAECERCRREDRGPLADAVSADRSRHVEGPHRQSRVVGFVLRDVGDRLVGITPPRVESADQFVDGSAGQELGGGFSLRLGDLVAGAPCSAVQHDHRVDEGARPVLEEPGLQGRHGGTQPGPGLVKVRGIDGQIRAQGARHAAHAGHRQVGGRLGAHTVG